MTEKCSVLFCAFFIVCIQNVSSLKIASVTWDKDSNKFSLHKGIVSGYVAKGAFRNEINTTGYVEGFVMRKF